MHSRSHNRKFTSYDDVNEAFDELFESICSRYLETSMRGSDFFDSAQLMHYKCHKVNFTYCGSYIDSSD